MIDIVNKWAFWRIAGSGKRLFFTSTVICITYAHKCVIYHFYANIVCKEIYSVPTYYAREDALSTLCAELNKMIAIQNILFCRFICYFENNNLDFLK